MAALGVTLDAQLPEREQSNFEVWPENVEAVQLFVRSSTQWRMGPGGPVGLDYLAVFRIMELYDIKDQQVTFEKLQVMEMAALVKINERNANG